MAGSQDYAPDPRNESVRVWLNGALLPRGEARVSIFDAGFVLGDGVWEGVRLHKGGLLFLNAHLDRLYAGARAIALDIGMSREEMARALRQLVAANGMQDGVHIRLMVTRGEKKTPNQDPRNALGRPTIAIVAEYKEPSAAVRAQGLNLFTSTIRCTPADMFDMRLNSHSRLNLVIALTQVIAAGADEALMLDPHGFVSSCNATNFFFVANNELCTSAGAYCFNGITRDNIIALCRRHGLPIRLGNFTLHEVYDAQEAFVTGTFGGVVPVRAVDGRALAVAPQDGLTRRLDALYRELKDEDAAADIGRTGTR
ncbi:MAG TPA: aminotransferase class IV [Rhizomicrobium sp.]|jgi:branched-chain amino acid aminotransferase|nr:aminotransferase class IV [Rhizomicrobium sp.]